VAATRFGAPLPPEGVVAFRKGTWTVARQKLAPEHEAKRLAALKEAKWTLDMLMALGTMPDKVLAENVGKTRNAVMQMRKHLSVPGVDVRSWDGRVKPALYSREELQRRWDAFREDQRRRAAERRRRVVHPGQGPFTNGEVP
jgi:hypothetical protein